MTIQELNCVCSMAHLNGVTLSDLNWNYYNKDKFNKFLEEEDYLRKKCILYICSDKVIYQRLKKIGFKKIGSYIGSMDNKVKLLGYYPNKPSFKEQVKKFIKEWANEL